MTSWFAGLFYASGLFALAYYLIVNGTYLIVHVAALFHLKDDLREHSAEAMETQFDSAFLPDVAVLVPAYNEAPVITDTVESLLTVNYPDTEIVVINDGSTDDTLARLESAFDLVEVDADLPLEIPAESIRAVYRTAAFDELLVIDKENGGKSDALNAGLWLTEQTYFCTIDADSILDQEGLRQVLRPFREHSDKTIACGGTVRIANGCTLTGGRITAVDLPSSWLAEIQAMEYLRAFYSGRLGLDKLKSLVLISGTFSVFKTDVVREIGGYATDSITEDFELIVRLHKHAIDGDEDYRIEFVPDPVVWTEVPESLGVLSKQRRRWYRGLIDTLINHRSMIANPRYGPVGLFGLPFMLFTEALGRLIEGLGYIILPVGYFLGFLDPAFLALYFVLTIWFGVFLSWFGIFSEVWSFRRYDDPRQILRLMGDAVLENVGFRQWKTYIAWRGLIEYLLNIDYWGEMRRGGFNTARRQTEQLGSMAASDDHR